MTIRPAGKMVSRFASQPRLGTARGCQILSAAAALLISAACGGEEPGTAPTTPSETAAAGTPATGAAGTPASASGPRAPGSTSNAGSAAKPTSPIGSAGSSAAAPTAAGSGAAAPTAAGGSAAPAPSATAGSAAPTPAPAIDGIPTVYWLDITSNSVYRSQNFEPGEAIVPRTGTAPDGVAVDVAGGKLYWTNMGSLLGTGGGTLQRANLDGSGVEEIVPAGVAQTPKQMQVDVTNKHIYWGDREGAKLWRANLDGSSPEAIVSEHGLREVVGIALDVPAGKAYFTDRRGGKILRTNLQMPAGETGANRTDVEELLIVSGGATPIDLDIDHEHKMIYWTDRMLGRVHSMGLEIPAGETAANRSDTKLLVDGLSEPIGMSLDVPKNKLYFTELNGGVSEAALDGTGLKKNILSSGSASGVALVYIPK